MAHCLRQASGPKLASPLRPFASPALSAFAVTVKSLGWPPPPKPLFQSSFSLDTTPPPEKRFELSLRHG
ncbi:UNVERIFIED_CONTAM: hypothetical protein K2H54_008359 [Gekko kuhli]